MGYESEIFLPTKLCLKNVDLLEVDGESRNPGSVAEGLALPHPMGSLVKCYHRPELSALGILLRGVALPAIPGWLISRPRKPRESRHVRIQGEWDVAASHNVCGDIKYFSLLTGTFLRVSSSKTLSSLPFRNEIMFTKIVISPGFCIPAVSCGGPCVTMRAVGLQWRWLSSPPACGLVGPMTSDPFTRGRGEAACQRTSQFGPANQGEFS